VNPGVPGVERLEEIGRGGSGVVYRGWQPDFGRWVAIKVFSPNEDVRRLERERLAVGRLSDHPAIAPVYGGGITGDGRPYLVMAYMEGGSLSDQISRYGPMSAEQSASVGLVLASALQVAHDHGIWHRDIKPANILYDRFGTPRLADFGIAHIGEGGFRTATGLVSGTAAYLAPELLDGHPFTAAADVFSLGATIYFALTGQAMFTPREGEPVSAFLLRRLDPDGPPPFPAGTPDSLRSVILEATAPQVQDRLPTASTLADRLARTGLRADIVTPPVTPSAPAHPPVPGSVADAFADFAVTTAQRSADFGQPTSTEALPEPARPYSNGRPSVFPQDTSTLVRDPSPNSRRRAWAVLAAVALLIPFVFGTGVFFVRRLWASARTTATETSTAAPSATSTTGSTADPVENGTASGSGESDPESDGSTTDLSGGDAIRAAVNAFRTTSGVEDPSMVEITFYPFPDPGDSPDATADMVQQDHPNLSDEYRWDEGQVGSPTPPLIPSTDIKTDQWKLSEVDWTAVDAMLDKTDKNCRAAMRKADLPDEPNTSGDGAGLTHVIVERDSVFLDGVVVVRVYFGGGARWDGGRMDFSGSGAVLHNYCTID
jgi:serine/threonine protein kinase